MIAGLEDTLARLLSDGTSEDIINLVRNSPPEYQGHYINQLLRNPSLSEYDLTSGVIGAMDKQKSNVLPSTPFEIQISNMFLPNQKQWPLVYLKKMRANQIDNRNFTYRGFDGGTPEDQIWNINTIFRQIADWARVVQTEDPRFQIAAYDFSQALNLSNEWHNMMAGKGSDKYYIPYQRDEHGNITDERVVYQFDDGWHISQLVNENDLTVEGNLMSHCFAPGAMVRALDGFKQIENIELGELVVCGDGTFRKVTKLFKQPYTGLMIRMGTRVGVGANLITPNHEFLSLKKLHGGEKLCQSHLCGKSSRYNEHEVHDVEWRPIEELSINSHLVVSYPLEYFDIDEIKIPLQYTGPRCKGSTVFNVDEEFLWMIGMFIAEGSATKNKMQFAISKHEIEYADRLESFFNKHNFGYHWRKDLDSYGGRVLVVCSKMLTGWFGDWLGKGCANKKIPSELLNLPNEKIEALARGVLDGDGCASRNVLHQTSSMLALQMSEISLRLGGFPSISVNHPKNKKTSYTLEGADALVPRTSAKRGFWQHKNYILAKPNVFETEQYSGFVYNLEVDTIHSYSVQNILVHNCVGGYCDEVDSGKSRIFSLRDPRNQPTVTIEMKGLDNIIKQIKAHSDGRPAKELRLRLAEWFGSDYFEGDAARFEGSDDSWDGPNWSGIYSAEDVISNIYEEAYGHIPYDDEENTSADYHSDYGVEGQENDFSRDIINLDVPDLLNYVEEAMIGVGTRREGIFEREKKYPSYSGVDSVFDTLAKVIVIHDEEMMSQLLSHDNTNSGRWHRDIYNAETGKWNIERVRDSLGVFDLTSKYRDSYEEELEDTELPKKDDGTVDYEDLSNEYDWKFKIYYNTLKGVYEELNQKPEMVEQYKQLTGRNLINDIYADSSGGLSGVWQRYNDTVQPKLMKHRDDFPKGYEPRDESGNIDESVFDEAGWKYSKFKGWYRTA